MKEIQENRISVNVLHDGRISLRDTAKYIGVSYAYLKDYYQKITTLEHNHVGRKVYFDIDELKRWIKSSDSDKFTS